ncbi:MAG: DUF4159 domain-containing protein [Acidobacteria bacterium]|nr:DUF4159 domain-containing protein [Acidobacteriota bacterium]
MGDAPEVGAGMSPGARRFVAFGLLGVALGTTMLAQRGYVPRPEGPTSRFGFGATDNQPYDGRFTFVRMSYPTGMNFGRRGGGAPWAHDYPLGEANFLKILTAVSNVPANLDGTNVLTFDDPEMFKYPVVYLVEPGYLTMNDDQVAALRAYLQKGGFMIVDDFPYWGWQPFELEMSRVLPGLEWQDLDVSHPIFHSFFDIETLDIVPAYPALGERPIFRALFADNNPAGKMYVVANYQNDLSEFWEYSESGAYAVDETNEAYKVGVNQFIYGLTR